MDSSKLILTEPVLPPTLLDKMKNSSVYKELSTDGSSGIDSNTSDSQEKNEQIAKDFESVLLYKLLDEMKNTIGDWGFEKDGISKQVQGIFWLNLAGDIANKGGLGLWKDIYEFLTQAESPREAGTPKHTNLDCRQTSTTIESLSEDI
jgi:Rod binding domain-containing protein